MKKSLALLALAVPLLVFAQSMNTPKLEPVAPLPKKRLLAIGQVKGFQHDSTTHGLATIERLGRVSGLWDTYIRTDTQLLTKQKLQGNAKNLDFFDGVLFFTTGELDLDDQQKADLMSFVKEEGKGFIGVHCAADTLYKWPEYGEMLGGWFDQHPWNTFDAPILNEDPSNPMVSQFPKEFVKKDEIYQIKNYSRDKLRVLLRLDDKKLTTNPRVHRTDGDFAVAWIKMHGKGRVFYSTLGHTHEAWDDPQIQKMYFEAAKWALRISGDDIDVTPRPKP